MGTYRPVGAAQTWRLITTCMGAVHPDEKTPPPANGPTSVAGRQVSTPVIRYDRANWQERARRLQVKKSAVGIVRRAGLLDSSEFSLTRQEARWR